MHGRARVNDKESSCGGRSGSKAISGRRGSFSTKTAQVPRESVARASLLVVDGGSRLDVVMWSDAAYATGESDGDRMEGAERVVVIRRIVLGSVGRQEQAKKDTAQRSTKAATGGCCAQGR
jgi:hypothetical protein